MSTKLVSKLASNLFLPDRIFAQPENVQELLLGTLLGICTGIHEKVGPDDTLHQGFTGTFEYVDADPKKSGYKSGILYLPAGINEMLLDAVKAADGGQVRFAHEVYAERSSNARKRAWSFRDLAEAETVDPMAELRKYLPGAAKPAEIAAPKDGATTEDKIKAAEAGKGEPKK